MFQEGGQGCGCFSLHDISHSSIFHPLRLEIKKTVPFLIFFSFPIITIIASGDGNMYYYPKTGSCPLPLKQPETDCTPSSTNGCTNDFQCSGKMKCCLDETQSKCSCASSGKGELTFTYE